MKSSYIYVILSPFRSVTLVTPTNGLMVKVVIMAFCKLTSVLVRKAFRADNICVSVEAGELVTAWISEIKLEGILV